VLIPVLAKTIQSPSSSDTDTGTNARAVLYFTSSQLLPADCISEVVLVANNRESLYCSPSYNSRMVI
jgi:hypothetical protein